MASLSLVCLKGWQGLVFRFGPPRSVDHHHAHQEAANNEDEVHAQIQAWARRLAVRNFSQLQRSLGNGVSGGLCHSFPFPATAP